MLIDRIGAKLTHRSEQSQFLALRDIGKIIQGRGHARRIGIICIYDHAIALSTDHHGPVVGRDIISDGLHPTVTAERFERFGRMLAAFAMAYILFFVYPTALGSGSKLVAVISHGGFTLGALAVLLIVKFIFSTASFGSGSPGGIFLPLLVLGAVTGGFFTRLLGPLGIGQTYITAFVVTAMAGYFAAIVRAPVTGVVLITETTGDFTTLLPLVLTSLIAYLTAELLGTKPIYTQLLERSLGKSHAGRTTTGRSLSSGRSISSIRRNSN